MKILDLKNTSQKKAIQEAVKTIQKGGLIIYPTETCYGAGVDSKNKEAVDKLFKFKGQRGQKPISVAVPDQKTAQTYVKLNSQAKNLYQNFLPGPLTVVSQSKGKLDPRLESSHQTLGIRIPNHPLALKLLKKLKTPLTSTSANSSGAKQPYSLSDFQTYTAKKSQKLTDLFLNYGKLKNRPTSTVVDTTLQEPEVLRKGAIKLDSSFNQKTTNSPQQTIKLAQTLTKKHSHLLKNSPLIIALQGELGAGKTQFVKGIGKALKVQALIKSPTYTIINEHKFKNGTLFHIDTWRLEKGEELKKLGLKPMLKPQNILAIEWLEKIRPLLENLNSSHPILWINIQKIAKNTRQISWQLTQPK